jgi:uncharacterized protein YjbI with pentapeptide repeats
LKDASLGDAVLGGQDDPNLALSSDDFTGASLQHATIDGIVDHSNLTDVSFVDAVMPRATFVVDIITGSSWDGTAMVPKNQHVPYGGPPGTVVSWPTPNGNHAITGLVSSCLPDSGSQFNVGTETVLCRVSQPDTDTEGLGSFVVTVDPPVSINGCTIVEPATPTSHTDCPGADLDNANLVGIDLSYANLHGANLSLAFGLSSTKLVDADLGGANLTDAVLFESDLRGVDLTDADLTGGGVQGSDLSGAELQGANLTSTDIAGTDFTGTILSPGDRIYPADGPSGRVTSWRKPAGFGSVTGVVSGRCSPAPRSTFPVGTTIVTCGIRDVGSASTATASFHMTILPVVEPGAGEVAAPSSGTADLAVTVSLNAAAPTTITVPWTTLHVAGDPRFYGAPQAPTTDYTATSGTATFLPGHTTAVVHIPVNADSNTGSEFVVISFHDLTGAYIGGFYGLGFGVIDPG